MSSYNGSCHCGTVKFTFTLRAPIEEQEVVNCNCSICTKNGYLMVYPKVSETTFNHPEDAVRTYYHATKRFPHFFCVNCGTSVYAKGPEGTDFMAVNARTIEGIEIEKLKLKPMDGRSL
ncbi:GFA family protein [Aspergillus undulatus]|uniref:GFA family protein n=1 Tax=Aspergillus undulatus TaxID=1810928 RepID=UPI003CCD981D